MKEYSRNCPVCSKVLTYSSYKNLWRANSRNGSCVECTRKMDRKPKNPNYFRNCPECNTTIYYNSKETMKVASGRKCLSCAQRSLGIGRLHTEESKQKISKNHARYWTGKDGYWKGKKRSDDTRKKIRIAYANKLKNRLTGSLRYSPKAVSMFQNIENILNLDGIYATKNGNGEFYIKELGYWVDYYEPNLNLVIEYDEKYHFRNKQKIRDLKRQSEIVGLLNCRFVRIKETDDVQTVYKLIKEVMK